MNIGEEKRMLTFEPLDVESQPLAEIEPEEYPEEPSQPFEVPETVEVAVPV